MAHVCVDELRDRLPTFQTTNDIYLLPNDAKEKDRLSELHDVLLALAGGQIVSAPIEDDSRVKTIVDVGCGVGRTTQDLARRFTGADTVYGIDLSPVPDLATDEASSNPGPRPIFVQGDFFDLAGIDSRFAWGSANLVWSRLLICGIIDWPGYVSRAFKLLKPGGWAQMIDTAINVRFEESVSPHPPGFASCEEWEWLRTLRQGGAMKGLDMDAGRNLHKYMRDAGFVDVETIPLRAPYWKEAVEEQPEAAMAIDHFMDDRTALFWHMLPRVTEGMRLSEAKVKQLQMDLRRDLGEEKGKYQIFYVVYGRKPVT